MCVNKCPCIVCELGLHIKLCRLKLMVLSIESFILVISWHSRSDILISIHYTAVPTRLSFAQYAALRAAVGYVFPTHVKHFTKPWWSDHSLPILKRQIERNSLNAAMSSEALYNKKLCQILCVIQTFCVHQLPYMRFFVVIPIKVYIRGILGDLSMTALCA